MATNIIVPFIVNEILIDDEDDEDINEMCDAIETILPSLFMRREYVPRVDNFVEDVLPAMSESDFRKHFRLSRTTAEVIHSNIEHLFENGAGGVTCLLISTWKKFVIFIWYLSNSCTMREISMLFGNGLYNNTTDSRNFYHECR